MQKILLSLISFYQLLVSPWIAPCCRFHPSCSEYAQQAILKHGCLKGLFLIIKRLLRCHPLCHGGYDPVPEK